MHYFVTGASGWIGSHVVAELIAGGHEVHGLARSDASADKLQAAGAQVVRGTIDDLDVLTAAASAADGVVHLAFKHDLAFTGQMDAASDFDLDVLNAFGDTLAGTDKPLLFASGIAGIKLGDVLTEDDRPGIDDAPSPRIRNEATALAFADRGVRVASLRFAPTVHGAGGDPGFIAFIAQIAKDKGVSGYIGDGANRWSAVNVLDAASLVRLALESVPAGSVLHAIGEQGVATREIAEAIAAAQGLETASIPADQAAEHFSWIGGFWGLDMPASSAATRQLLGWEPTHPGLVADIVAGEYTPAA